MQRLCVRTRIRFGFRSGNVEYLIQNWGKRGKRKTLHNRCLINPRESRLIASLVLGRDTRRRRGRRGRRGSERRIGGAFSSSVGLQIDSRARQIEESVVYPPFTIYRSACTPLATPAANFPSFEGYVARRRVRLIGDNTLPSLRLINRRKYESQESGGKCREWRRNQILCVYIYMCVRE